MHYGLQIELLYYNHDSISFYQLRSFYLCQHKLEGMLLRDAQLLAILALC